MGKGDRKTKRGKINSASYGNYRQHDDRKKKRLLATRLVHKTDLGK